MASAAQLSNYRVLGTPTAMERCTKIGHHDHPALIWSARCWMLPPAMA